MSHSNPLGRKNLVIASGNKGKILEFKKLLSSLPLNILAQPDKFHVEEDGFTFIENARKKALSVAIETKEWTLSDDSGLCVEALSFAPGVHSARYAENDLDRINKLLKEMEGIENRNAFFSSALCLASPDAGILLEVEGKSFGRIVKFPRGNNGFGYDPIFEVNRLGLTFAEMDQDQKKNVGHRGKAFSKLYPLILNLLKKEEI